MMGLNLQGGGLDGKPLSSGSIGIFISHVSSSALNFTTYNNGVYDLEIVSDWRVTRLL